MFFFFLIFSYFSFNFKWVNLFQLWEIVLQWAHVISRSEFFRILSQLYWLPLDTTNIKRDIFVFFLSLCLAVSVQSLAILVKYARCRSSPINRRQLLKMSCKSIADWQRNIKNCSVFHLHCLVYTLVLEMVSFSVTACVGRTCLCVWRTRREPKMCT